MYSDPGVGVGGTPVAGDSGTAAMPTGRGGYSYRGRGRAGRGGNPTGVGAPRPQMLTTRQVVDIVPQDQQRQQWVINDGMATNYGVQGHQSAPSAVSFAYGHPGLSPAPIQNVGTPFPPASAQYQCGGQPYPGQTVSDGYQQAAYQVPQAFPGPGGPQSHTLQAAQSTISDQQSVSHPAQPRPITHGNPNQYGNVQGYNIPAQAYPAAAAPAHQMESYVVGHSASANALVDGIQGPVNTTTPISARLVQPPAPVYQQETHAGHASTAVTQDQADEMDKAMLESRFYEYHEGSLVGPITKTDGENAMYATFATDYHEYRLRSVTRGFLHMDNVYVRILFRGQETPIKKDGKVLSVGDLLELEYDNDIVYFEYGQHHCYNFDARRLGFSTMTGWKERLNRLQKFPSGGYTTTEQRPATQKKDIYPRISTYLFGRVKNSDSRNRSYEKSRQSQEAATSAVDFTQIDTSNQANNLAAMGAGQTKRAGTGSGKTPGSKRPRMSNRNSSGTILAQPTSASTAQRDFGNLQVVSHISAADIPGQKAAVVETIGRPIGETLVDGSAFATANGSKRDQAAGWQSSLSLWTPDLSRAINVIDSNQRAPANVSGELDTNFTGSFLAESSTGVPEVIDQRETAGHHNLASNANLNTVVTTRGNSTTGSLMEASDQPGSYRASAVRSMGSNQPDHQAKFMSLEELDDEQLQSKISEQSTEYVRLRLQWNQSADEKRRKSLVFFMDVVKTRYNNYFREWTIRRNANNHQAAMAEKDNEIDQLKQASSKLLEDNQRVTSILEKHFQDLAKTLHPTLNSPDSTLAVVVTKAGISTAQVLSGTSSDNSVPDESSMFDQQGKEPSNTIQAKTGGPVGGTDSPVDAQGNSGTPEVDPRITLEALNDLQSLLSMELPNDT